MNVSLKRLLLFIVSVMKLAISDLTRNFMIECLCSELMLLLVFCNHCFIQIFLLFIGL